MTGLVLPPRNPWFDRTRLGGLGLIERAIRELHRAGVDDIVVSAERLDDPALTARLAAGGIVIRVAHRNLLAALPQGNGVVIVSADVVFESGALTRLVDSGRGDATHGRRVQDAAGGMLAYLPPSVLDTIRVYDSVYHGLSLLHYRGVLVSVDVSPLFCRSIPADGAVLRLERDYIRARNGSEGCFTRIIRIFSAPVSQALLRLRVSALPAVKGALVGQARVEAILGTVKLGRRAD
jgi:hypothetical protein